MSKKHNLPNWEPGQRLVVVRPDQRLRVGQRVTFKGWYDRGWRGLAVTSAGILYHWRFKPVVRVKMGREHQ